LASSVTSKLGGIIMAKWRKPLEMICQCGKKYRWSGYHFCIACRIKHSLLSGKMKVVRQKC
jgi:hypothetical protein